MMFVHETGTKADNSYSVQSLLLSIVLIFHVNPTVTEDEEVQDITVSLVEVDLGNLALVLTIATNDNTSGSTGKGLLVTLLNNSYDC